MALAGQTQTASASYDGSVTSSAGYGVPAGSGGYAGYGYGADSAHPSSPPHAPGLEGEDGVHAPLANAGSSRKRGRESDDNAPEGSGDQGEGINVIAAEGDDDHRPSKQARGGNDDTDAATSSSLLDGINRGADGKSLDDSGKSIGGIEGGPSVGSGTAVEEGGGQLDAGSADVSTGPGDAAAPAGLGGAAPGSD